MKEESKIEDIRHKLEEIEKMIQECKAILRGEAC